MNHKHLSKLKNMNKLAQFIKESNTIKNKISNQFKIIIGFHAIPSLPNLMAR
jgi:hypothetical protein